MGGGDSKGQTQPWKALFFGSVDPFLSTRVIHLQSDEQLRSVEFIKTPQSVLKFNLQTSHSISAVTVTATELGTEIDHFLL
jgi:hypothetical protein